MTHESKGATHAPPTDEASAAVRPAGMLKRAFGVFDTLETAVVAAIATLAFLGLVLVLPLAVARELIGDSKIAAAVILLSSTGLLLALAIRDLLRWKWSLASRVLAALWFVILLVVAALS
jgi:hypothetical protein